MGGGGGGGQFQQQQQQHSGCGEEGHGTGPCPPPLCVQEVWVKVLSLNTGGPTATPSGGSGPPARSQQRISLSMRDVDQATGKDLLPTHLMPGAGGEVAMSGLKGLSGIKVGGGTREGGGPALGLGGEGRGGREGGKPERWGGSRVFVTGFRVLGFRV